MAGPLPLDPSAVAAATAGAGFVFGAVGLALAAALACARAAAAASFVPNSSVKSVSRDDFRSAALAHLLVSVRGKGGGEKRTYFRSEVLLLTPPRRGPKFVQLSGGEGRVEM